MSKSEALMETRKGTGEENGGNHVVIPIEAGSSSSVSMRSSAKNTANISAPASALSKNIAGSKPNRPPRMPENPRIKANSPSLSDDVPNPKENLKSTGSKNRGKCMFSIVGKIKLQFSIFEGFVCVLFLGGLIASLTMHMFKNHVIWVLEMWRWCVLVLVIVAGRIIMGWMMKFAVCSVKWIFLFMKWNVYYSYCIHGLGECIGVFLWFGWVMLTWYLLESSEVKRSKLTSQILHYITRSLATLLIGGFLWVLKTLLVNILSTSFQVTRFFHRIRKSLVDQHILKVFSMKDIAALNMLNSSFFERINHNQLPTWSTGERVAVEVISWLMELKSENISAWLMEDLITITRSSELSTITNKLEKLVNKEQEDVIKLFAETNNAADQIFKNVRRANKSDHGNILNIVKDDLSSLFAEKADYVVQHINGGEEHEKIERMALRTWLVTSTLERKSLVQSLDDTRKAIQELNKHVNAVVLVLLLIIWVIMLGILTTEIFLLIISQFFALTFLYGDTAKSVFQGIIFLFVMHPFDIDDRCLIDREEVVVEKINLYTTVFRKNAKEKIVYPNSVLTTLPIRKLYKDISDVINDAVEIAIDKSTSDELIRDLRSEISRFLKDGNNKNWLPAHNFVFNAIKDAHKLKMVLYVSYRKLNFRSDRVTRNRMRDALVATLRKFFEEKKMKYYYIMPQATEAE